MKTVIESYVLALDKSTGRPVVANGNNLAQTVSGKQVWFPQAAKPGKLISYIEHSKGETFVAARDSKRVHPEGHENEGQPIYMKGDTVSRLTDSVEFVGFSDEAPVAAPVSMEEKFALAQKYGVTITM